jgi:4-hydroxybenzoyl-CoA thioesterase
LEYFSGDPLMTRFVRSYKIRFNECDMAGIVFFPNYLVMFNRLLEDWFEEALEVPLGDLHSARKSGVPLVDLKISFKKACRVGELLKWGLEVRRLGAKSFTLSVSASCNGEERIALETTLVAVNLITTGVSSQEIPADLRAAMEPFVVVN